MRFLKRSLPAKTLQSSAYEPETHTPTFWVRHLDSRFPRVMQLVSLTRSVVWCLGWMIILWQFELVNSPCYVCATCFGFSHELPVAVVGKHTSVKVGQIERCPRKKEVVDIRLSVHLHQFGSDNLNVLNNTSLIRCEMWTQLQRLITFCTEYYILNDAYVDRHSPSMHFWRWSSNLVIIPKFVDADCLQNLPLDSDVLQMTQK